MSIDDRMKLYESMYAQEKLMPLVPMIARIDGKTFHTWTKGLVRPYDERLSQCFIETTKYLVQHTNAKVGYTQSDEITLAYYSDAFESQLFFNQRIQKVISVLASMTTAIFNQKVNELIPEKVGKLALFDARVWSVPNLVEAANVFIWRELDATKNSISMAAQHYYSHKELHKKGQATMQEMLFQKGINWNNYPSFFKRGTYIQRRLVTKNINGNEAIRSVYEALDLPPILSIGNKVEVLFESAEPVGVAA